MKHVYTVEAESESELVVYTQAMSRYCADHDFENALRRLWKDSADELTEVEWKIVERIWDMWHANRANIGEVE